MVLLSIHSDVVKRAPRVQNVREYRGVWNDEHNDDE
jgi:hypothetical protein